jgi:hypothetical protein
MKFWYFTIVFIAVIMFALFMARGYLTNKKAAPVITLPSATTTIIASPTSILSLTPTEVNKAKGTIEGSLSYPSERLPENMLVCAESVEMKQTTCTDVKMKDNKYTYGVGYKLDVPVGKYFVYAKLPENDDNYAYYSEFVTCGLLASCTSHKPIEIEVKANQTTSKVDPQDWYNIQPSL